MAKAKKTISVKTILETVNKRNAKSYCSKEVREGWNSLLETILLDTGNYEGFTYLSKDKVPAGEKPGVNVGDSGPENLTIEERFQDTDETRVFYLLSNKLS